MLETRKNKINKTKKTIRKKKCIAALTVLLPDYEQILTITTETI